MSKVHRYFSALLAVCLSLGLVLCVAVGTASAHAAVIAATPGIGSTITQIPTTIQVTTAENMTIKPSEDNLFVYSPKGDLISVGDAKVDFNNPMHMSVAIKTTAGNGVYVVRWITKSANDGDPDAGAFYFTVNPSGTKTSAVTASTPSTANTSSPVLPAVITGIIALIIGLGAGLSIGRRGSAPAVPASSDTEVTQESQETTPRT